MLHLWVRRVLRVWVRIVTFADDCYILKIITFVGVTGSIKVHCKLSLKSSHVFVIVYVRQISNKKKTYDFEDNDGWAMALLTHHVS